MLMFNESEKNIVTYTKMTAFRTENYLILYAENDCPIFQLFI